MRSLYLSCGLVILLGQSSYAQPIVSPPPASAVSAGQFAATDGPALTLTQAIELAMTYNPDLSATAREIGVADSGIVQARTRPNPELSLLSEGLQQDNRTTTVQINQPIELGGKRAARINAAERERELALAELAAKRADVRATVIAAYFEVLTAQERLELALGSQQVAQAASNAAARRVVAGRISPVEETRAKVAEASARVELGLATSALVLAQRAA